MAVLGFDFGPKLGPLSGNVKRGVIQAVIREPETDEPVIPGRTRRSPIRRGSGITFGGPPPLPEPYGPIRREPDPPYIPGPEDSDIPGDRIRFPYGGYGGGAAGNYGYGMGLNAPQAPVPENGAEEDIQQKGPIFCSEEIKKIREIDNKPVQGECCDPLTQTFIRILYQHVVMEELEKIARCLQQFFAWDVAEWFKTRWESGTWSIGCWHVGGTDYAAAGTFETEKKGHYVTFFDPEYFTEKFWKDKNMKMEEELTRLLFHEFMHTLDATELDTSFIDWLCFGSKEIDPYKKEIILGKKGEATSIRKITVDGNELIVGSLFAWDPKTGLIYVHDYEVSVDPEISTPKKPKLLPTTIYWFI